MAKRFRPYQPHQILLLPPDPKEWLPENHIVYFIDEITEQLDLTAIYAKYQEERGYPPYDPRMMVKVWVYAYYRGIQSSRKLEQALHDDIAFRYLAGNQQPDHWTLSEFRRRHLEALGNLLVQSIGLAKKAGLVTMQHVAIDGTKIEANASKHTAMSYPHMVKEAERLRQEIERYLKMTEQMDQKEEKTLGNRCHNDLPPALATKQLRMEALQKAQEELRQEQLSTDDTISLPPPGSPLQEESGNESTPGEMTLPDADAQHASREGYNNDCGPDSPSLHAEGDTSTHATTVVDTSAINQHKPCDTITSAPSNIFPTLDERKLRRDLAIMQRKLANIEQAKAELEREAQVKFEADQAKRAATAAQEGRDYRPRKNVADILPKDKAQRCFTDPDARLMHSRRYGCFYGFNCQAIVDVDSHIILAAGATNQAADTTHLPSMTQQMIENTGIVPKMESADAGYYSDSNLDALESQQIEAFIPPERISHSEWRAQLPPQEPVKVDADRQERMKHKLRTQEGRDTYKKRQESVEPTFGQIKECMGFRRLVQRGEVAAHNTWRFVTAIHNLVKIYRAQRQPLEA